MNHVKNGMAASTDKTPPPAARCGSNWIQLGSIGVEGWDSSHNISLFMHGFYEFSIIGLDLSFRSIWGESFYLMLGSLTGRTIY